MLAHAFRYSLSTALPTERHGDFQCGHSDIERICLVEESRVRGFDKKLQA